MVTHDRKAFTARELGLMLIAFLGIFVYGLLAALPGAVLPTLERNRYLPNEDRKSVV